MLNAKVISVGKTAPDYEVVLSQLVHKLFINWVMDKVNAEHPGLTFEQALPYIKEKHMKYLLPSVELAVDIVGDNDNIQIVTLSGEVIL